MKKIGKTLLVFVSLLSLVLLASCSKVNQKYADKINAAAESGEHYTVEKIRKDLGDEAIEILILNNGVIIAVKGVKSEEDLEEKLESEEVVEGLLITILNGKAISATYEEIDLSDLK